jgi:hypothetical protein
MFNNLAHLLLHNPQRLVYGALGQLAALGRGLGAMLDRLR